MASTTSIPSRSYPIKYGSRPIEEITITSGGSTVGDFIDEVKKHLSLSTCKLSGLRPTDSKIKFNDNTPLSQCVVVNKKFINIIGSTLSTAEKVMNKQAECKANEMFDIQEDHYEWIVELRNNEIRAIEDAVEKEALPHTHKSTATLKTTTKGRVVDERKAMVEYACVANKFELLKFTGLLGGKGEEPANAVQALNYAAMLNRPLMFSYILGHDRAQLKRAEEMGTKAKTRLLGSNDRNSYRDGNRTYSHLDCKEFEYVATACQYGNLDFVKLLLSDEIPDEFADATRASGIFIPGFRPVLYRLGLTFWRQCVSLSMTNGHLKQTRWLLHEAKKNLSMDDEEKLLESTDLETVCAKGYLGHAQYLVSRGFPVTIDVLASAANLYIGSNKTPRNVCLNLLKFLASKSSPKLMRELLDRIVSQNIADNDSKSETIYKTIDLITLLIHPAGGNVNIDAGMVGDGDFKSLIEWSAQSGKSSLIVECAVNAHLSKRANEKHKCGHLLTPPNYGTAANVSDSKEPIDSLSLDDESSLVKDITSDLAQEIKVLTGCSLHQYVNHHGIEVRESDHDAVENSTIIMEDCSNDSSIDLKNCEDVIVEQDGKRKRRKINMDKLYSLDSLSQCMKDHMRSIHRAADHITKRYDSRYLDEEIAEDLKKGKTVIMDNYKANLITTPIDMMAYLLSMAALPSINVSIFSPTQQECLLYAYKKMSGLEVMSVQIIDRIGILPATSKLKELAPLIVQYVHFFELKHFHERGMLKIATDQNVWNKIME